MSLVKLEDKRIDESSGIAVSRASDDIFYTHNDSGDVARYFKFNRKGEVLAAVNVTNASATDWEDMACETVRGKPYLYLGDIGDNAAKRSEITVYRVPEPRDNPTSVTADAIFTLHYPDGPHNAETLLINPANGDLYIVTKAPKKPSKVFKLAAPTKTGTYTLKELGEIQFESPIKEGRLITSGDISADSKHVLLRTYMAAYEYDVSGNFDGWFKGIPRPIKTNLEFQGEGICYGRDGTTLYTSSEGSPCLVSTAKLATGG